MSSGIKCQAVIVRLTADLRSALSIDESLPVALALISSHDHLHSKIQLKDWKLHIGIDGLHKQGSFKLTQKYFSHFYTCCGPHGIWGGNEVHLSSCIDESSCPFQANFSVFILRSFLTEYLLKKDLTIPLVPLLNECSFSQILHGSTFTLLQRGSLGIAEAHKVILCPSSSNSSMLCDEGPVEETILAYNSTCQLQYTCKQIEFFDSSSAGAAIVYFDHTADNLALKLGAIHLFSCRVDDTFVHHGISVPAIFHAIAG